MVYTVVKVGGKQFAVEPGQVLKVPSISGKKEGEQVELEAILSFDDGKLQLGSKVVKATIIGHGKGEKIIVFKKKRRKQYKRKKGHRQGYTEIKIEDF
ncbi:MAG: 50S ribosomal protein L21 [Pyrinomonadaceae bacterium]|nr:50S ribosomal protein L21 [Pyrinomonadaceae bacterium]MCX7639169.1 50S ribosomal protein L21 [Pyrinomonadaceae bacterium]MDW8303610.1 50S ribosomal protein L21 [Acidobacteriota bacterium]